MEKLAIVGVFYDGYYDLWEDFLECFERFWPNCPYKKYIINNVRELEYEKKYKVEVIHAGEDAEYSRKVQSAIKCIDADYYLLLLDDFFMGEMIYKDPLSDIIRFMKRENIDYYSMPLKEFQTNNGKKIYKDISYLRKILPKSEYTVSCQPAIWKRDFLKACIGEENYNAWVFEGIYTKSKLAHSECFLERLCVDQRNVLHLYHGALQGAIIPDTYEHFISIGYRFRSKRKILSNQQYQNHNKKVKLKEIVPVFIIKIIKKFLKTNSVIDRYKREINETMRKMGIE